MDLERSYMLAASWLLDSFRANHGFGSSAWYSRALHPIRGWSHPYPETTGYIIPTLYDLVASHGSGFPCASICIDRSVSWLVSMQMASGALPGGHAVGRGAYYLNTSDYVWRRGRPPVASVFNTGQILRGLMRHYEETSDAATFEAIRKCALFLFRGIDETGVWQADAYAGSSSPSYFTYVTSALLQAAPIVGNEPDYLDRSLTSLRRVVSRVSSKDSFINGMGFGGVNRAFTHTVGYTLQGFLESARCLGDSGRPFFDVVIGALERILGCIDEDGSLPGSFEPGWKGDRSFCCVTGDAQIALCLLDVYRSVGSRVYLEAALRLLGGVRRTQHASGGFPGSVPLRGKYMRWRYPNWAVKYYMDLVAATRRVEDV